MWWEWVLRTWGSSREVPTGPPQSPERIWDAWKEGRESPSPKEQTVWLVGSLKLISHVPHQSRDGA